MGRTLIEILNALQGKKDPRKTMVLPSRRPGHLGRRRLNQAPSTFYLRYFDLGCVSGGADIDFTMAAPVDYVEVPNLIDSPGSTPQVYLEYSDFKEELLDYFGTPSDGWLSTYQKITPTIDAEYSSLTFTGEGLYDNEEEGYLYALGTTPTQFGVSGSGRVFYEALLNHAAFKVTASDSYAAPDVGTFNVDADCDMFLMPQIQLRQGHNLDVVGFQELIQISTLLSPFQRAVEIDNATFDAYLVEHAAYTASLGGGNRWAIGEAWSTAYHSFWINLGAGHPDAATVGTLFNRPSPSGAPPLIIDGGSLGGSSFYMGPGFGFAGMRSWHIPEGLCVMIVRKRKPTPEWYWVWQKTTVNRPLNISPVPSSNVIPAGPPGQAVGWGGWT